MASTVDLHLLLAVLLAMETPSGAVIMLRGAAGLLIIVITEVFHSSIMSEASRIPLVDQFKSKSFTG